MDHYHTKHIEMRCHWLCLPIEDKLLQPKKIHTDGNVADMLTKVVSTEKLELCAKFVGLNASWVAQWNLQERFLVFFATLIRCVDGRWMPKCYYFKNCVKRLTLISIYISIHTFKKWENGDKRANFYGRGEQNFWRVFRELILLFLAFSINVSKYTI